MARGMDPQFLGAKGHLQLQDMGLNYQMPMKSANKIHNVQFVEQ